MDEKQCVDPDQDLHLIQMDDAQWVYWVKYGYTVFVFLHWYNS